MSVLLAHVRAGTLELLRMPGYSVPTLLFPSLLFLLFAARGRAEDESTAPSPASPPWP